MIDVRNLTAVPNNVLLGELAAVVKSQRKGLARLLIYLAEVEERRIHLDLAYRSMFEFCMVKLRMSEGEAYRRITAARLMRRFPAIVAMVESGALHLSGLGLLSPHLTRENHAELLTEASNKSKKQIEELLAVRAPKPDVASTIRKLPERTKHEDAPPVAVAAGLPGLNDPASVPVDSASPALPAASASPAASHAGSPNPAPSHAGLLSPARSLGGSVSPAPSPQRERGRIEPLSLARYKVQFTASEELRNKIEHAANLMSHANPTRDLAVLIERAIDLLIDKLERTVQAKANRRVKAKGKTAAEPSAKADANATANADASASANVKTSANAKADTNASASANASARGSRDLQARRANGKRSAIPRENRRNVFVRDGGQCAFIGPDGRRCTARAFLQVDHEDARARGGSDELENLRLLCRPHNLRAAEESFGREHIERCVRSSQRRSRANDRARTELHEEIREKLTRALTGLGFRRSDVRTCLDLLQSGRGAVPWESSIEDLLRAAAQMLTK